RSPSGSGCTRSPRPTSRWTACSPTCSPTEPYRWMGVPVNPTVASITARGLLGRRRVFALLPLPVLLRRLAVLAHALQPNAEHVSRARVAGLGFAVVLPMIALIVGTGVVGAEIDDGTIVHMLATPLRRRDIVLTKLAVASAVVTVATAVPMFITGVVV